MEIHHYDVATPDGRVVRVHDTAPGRADLLPVVWHHGARHDGRPPDPLNPTVRRLGLRVVGIDRPGYGGSTLCPGRTVAATAGDVVTVADALGLDRFASVGYSSGGGHALASAARSPDRVGAVVSLSALAPPDAAALDWQAGLSPALLLLLRAAAQGREERLRHQDTSGRQGGSELNDADRAALAGPWSWFSEAAAAAEVGDEARADEHVALAAPWGFDLATVRCPTLVVHGDLDPIVPPTHGQWLGSAIPGAQLWVAPEDGHVSVLGRGEAALEWLARHHFCEERG